LPARFGSVDDAIREWVFGTNPQGMPAFAGNVVDYFNRQLGVVLQPVGGPMVWHVGMAQNEYLDAAGKVLEPSVLRGLVKSKLAAQLAAANLSVAGLDTDGDNMVEAPGNIGDRIEVLVLALDNLGGRGGQTGGTAPDPVAIGGNHSWAGKVSGLGVASGVASMCHELLHQFGTKDLYGAGLSRNAGSTTMAAVPADPDDRVRLDPWHELQFGVLTPQVADLTAAGSLRIEHAGGDPGNRAVLLVDPSRRFEGFLIQLRIGPQDPIDRQGPDGWCVWQVTVEGGTAERQLLPSQTQAGGWDASINLLAAPGLERGGGGPNRGWPSGSVTPELHWWNGQETGIRLAFTTDASGISGTVTWQPVPGSWRWREPALQTWAVGNVPCLSAPVVAIDPVGGWPVVAASNSAGQMMANQTFDEQSLLPWGWPDRVKPGRDVAMVTTNAGIASAFTLDSGNILVDYPPWDDPAVAIPPEFSAPGVTGRPAITLWRDTLLVAWTDGSVIRTAERTKSERTWRRDVIAPPDVTARPRAGTGVALVTTSGGTCFLAWNDDNLEMHILRRDRSGDWNARFQLDYGSAPAVLPIRAGIPTLETPAMCLGPDGAVWFAIPTPGPFPRIAYGRAPAVLATLEQSVVAPGKPSPTWPALWRMVDVGPIAGPVSVCPSTSGLTVAWTPELGQPAHVALLPTN
jgi:hypothetical protein